MLPLLMVMYWRIKFPPGCTRVFWEPVFAENISFGAFLCSFFMFSPLCFYLNKMYIKRHLSCRSGEARQCGGFSELSENDNQKENNKHANKHTCADQYLQFSDT